MKNATLDECGWCVERTTYEIHARERCHCAFPPYILKCHGKPPNDRSGIFRRIDKLMQTLDKCHARLLDLSKLALHLSGSGCFVFHAPPAMLHALNKRAAWTLIVALTVISGVGEGLHFVPGCGHATPDGSHYFLLGVGGLAAQFSADGQECVDRHDGSSIPIYDEDQCSICSLIGQHSTAAKSFQFILVMPLVHELPAVAIIDTPVATTCCFQARAPPLV